MQNINKVWFRQQLLPAEELRWLVVHIYCLTIKLQMFDNSGFLKSIRF